MKNIRTDLALEAHELLLEAAEELSGVTLTDCFENDIKITHVKVQDDEAAEKLNKPIGNYITFELPDIRYMDKTLYENVCKKISEKIKELTGEVDKKKPVLIIGLGNRGITSDSLGPAAIDRLMITRHLFSYAPESISENLGSVCAISPGVLGITGIETLEIIKGVCEKVEPSLIICIDALAARGIDRIMRTVQICDTGINPGSGVGNNRKEISEKTMGVPVLAVGVPTVIDAATVTFDTLNIVIESILKQSDNSPFFEMLKNLDHNERYHLIKTSVSSSMPEFCVTPKEVDMFIGKASEIVANGINFALHKDITFEDIKAYIS